MGDSYSRIWRFSSDIAQLFNTLLLLFVTFPTFWFILIVGFWYVEDPISPFIPLLIAISSGGGEGCAFRCLRWGVTRSREFFEADTGMGKAERRRKVKGFSGAERLQKEK